MSQLREDAIRDVVTEVLSKLQTPTPVSVATPAIKISAAKHGVFDDAKSAAKAASAAPDGNDSCRSIANN